MENGKYRKYSKGIIDIIMIVGLIGCILSLSVFEKLEEEFKKGAKIEDVFTWKTPHCIISVILISIICIHILQHRAFLKMIISKNRYLNNKLITLTIVLFLLTLISVLFYIFGFTMTSLHFHSLIVPFFVLIIVVHLVMNFKKLIKLFKNV